MSLAAALSFASAATGLTPGAPGAAAAPVSSGVENLRNAITVAPVGVNLGAILQPYQESAYNGGGGVDLPSAMAMGGNPYGMRQAPPGTRVATAGAFSGGGLAVAGVVVFGALALVLFKRKRG